MKNHRLPLVLALTLVLALAVTAGAYPAGDATASIQILSPDNHAVLDAGESYALEYAITLGPKDDHFHVWVDGERSPGIHDLKGSYRLPKLTPGPHTITLKLVDKGHVPTGPEKTIQVTSK
jgi:hypothetical protein